MWQSCNVVHAQAITLIQILKWIRTTSAVDVTGTLPAMALHTAASATDVVQLSSRGNNSHGRMPGEGIACGLHPGTVIPEKGVQKLSQQDIWEIRDFGRIRAC